MNLQKNPTGLHVWLPVSKRDETKFIEAARQLGVAVAPGASFCISDTPHESAVRICLGGVSEIELSNGLTAIRKLFLKQDEPVLTRDVVSS